MPNLTVKLSKEFNSKSVVVGSQEEKVFVKSLVANDQLADKEAGVNPKGATHEVVQDGEGNYRVKRTRFSAF